MSEWTVKTLKKYFERALKEERQARKIALDSLNDRLKLLNELRGNVATKEEIKALEKVIDGGRGFVVLNADLLDGQYREGRMPPHTD